MSKVNTKHYRQHPSNIECIEITRHMGFNLGNALKYIWRADHKNSSPVEDLKKATWYLLDQLYLITGDSYYLNRRDEIEGYTVSIEPLQGLVKAVEVKEDDGSPKRPSHITIPFDAKSPYITFPETATNLPHKDYEEILANTPVIC